MTDSTDTTTTTAPAATIAAPASAPAPAPAATPAADSISRRESELSAQLARQTEQMAALQRQVDDRANADGSAQLDRAKKAHAVALADAQALAKEQAERATSAMSAARKNAALAYLTGLRQPERMVSQFLGAVELGDDLTLTDESKARLDTLRDELGFAFERGGDGRTTPMGGTGPGARAPYSPDQRASFREAGVVPGAVFESDVYKKVDWWIGHGKKPFGAGGH